MKNTAIMSHTRTVRRAVLLCILLMSVLLLAACTEQLPVETDTDGLITLPVTETGENDPETNEPETDENGETLDAEETKPYDPDDHPGDSTLYSGVMIAAVHGTGKKGAEAVISNGYVQLYNSTDKAISLAGASLYYKSDGANPFSQFVFPEGATIPAGGYYLVRANSPSDFVPDNAILTVEHFDAEWDVYIDNKEVRLLLAPSGWSIGREEDITDFDDAVSVFVASETYVDSVYAVTDLSRNKIAVRTALKDYSGYHLVNLTRAATPDLEALCTRTSDGRVNEVATPRITEVLFSHNAGIYTNAISLYLDAPEGYTIYYTTDGSDPSDASNAKRVFYVREQGITLSDTSAMSWGPVTKQWGRYPSSSTQIGAHVIKACAINGEESTGVFTNTYFITDDLAAYGVSIISISLPQEEIMGNGFYQNYCPTGVLTDTRPRGVGILEVFDPAGNRVGNSRVEMAVSGNGSSGAGMKSLRIYYKGINNQDAGLQSDLNYDIFGGLAKDQNGEAITSFSRLLLRNSGNDCGTSYIRDAYMQRVSAGLNVDTMATASTLVFINGEFWGVYNIRERYSPEYVESHYGIQKENVTIIESDYSQVHTDTNAPFVLSSGVEGDEEPFNEMVQYMRDHDLSDPTHYEYICSQMDIDSFIDMWVLRLFFVARDWPENNIKIWRNKNPDDPSGFDTKWHFTLLDMDMGLSFYDFTTERENFMWAFDSNSVTGTMMRALLKNEDFKNQFLLRYYEVINEHLTPDYLGAELEAMIAERDGLMSLQQVRWASDGASVSKWNSECEKMRSFVANRVPYALRHLYERFGITEEQLESLSEKRATVNFHSGRAEVQINGAAVENGAILKFENGGSLTVHVTATAKEGFVVEGISFIDRTGKTQEVQGGSATFHIRESGTISIHTSRVGGENMAAGSLVAGATYAFYLSEGGDLYAWGDNRYGVLGLPTSLSTTVKTPTFVMSGVAKVATSAGNAYENDDTTFSTAILTTDGRVLTVGRNTAGQLGRGGTTDSYTLAEINFSGKVTDISMGHDHLLIVDENGDLWGIGANNYGALGATNAGGNVTSFTKIAGGVLSASAGRRSTVYLTTDGRLWGLGDNRWKKLSQSHGDQIHTPVVLASGIDFVDSGEHQILAVDASGKLYYAGWRSVQGFAQGGGNNPTVATLMASGVRKADSYFGNVTILTTSGDAYIYGINTDGGLGESVTNGTPKKILSDVSDVAAGYGFTVYLMKDGRILVRGNNSYGQAGNGTAGGSVDLVEVDF